MITNPFVICMAHKHTTSQYTNKQLVWTFKLGQDIQKHLNIFRMALKFNINVLVIIC